ncbi:MAG: hypothetical protein IT244_08225 [Bacteroidia bacterium]|nr:hypothetical protein [Bacteroidia bacterium]
MNKNSEHTFHIPVMGIAFTIDSPVKVARFGITSVVSIIEDRLIEMMRKHYYSKSGQEYLPITTSEPDYRAKRITDYLNLLNKIVQEQMQKLRTEAFEQGAEIVKYFEMLPEASKLKRVYNEMICLTNWDEKKEKEKYLRDHLIPGSIDVNIMTKTDRENLDVNGDIIKDGSDAVAALRGFVNSELDNSAIVFSAGMNPRLFSYLETVNAFDPDENFNFKKRVIVKVSDFRSALIQGKFLAKKGIWVSEFRIESGLNCGGHAFATDGFLMGPILEEFKVKRSELSETIFQIYQSAIHIKTGKQFANPPTINISVQGGIGTHSEDYFLHQFFGVSSTGWGTPFLLVPEATTVDSDTMELLKKATEKDVVLSNNSPLGVRFYYLKGTTADKEKKRRIDLGKPGSPCTEKYLEFNTEFTTEPICTASHKYQKKKLAQIKASELSAKEKLEQSEAIMSKECLCVGLSNAAPLTYNETFLNNLKSVNICPGPNIVNFSEEVSLQKMVNHVYGREKVQLKSNRPHMFIAELQLYINYLKEQLLKENYGDVEAKGRKSYFQGFIKNLLDGITYYRNLPFALIENESEIIDALYKAEMEIDSIKHVYSL